MTKPGTKGQGGKRPPGFNQKTADEILELIASGESVRAICRRGDMPAMSTVFKWLSQRPEFAIAYSAAMEVRADAIFDDVLEIADDARNDWMEANGEDDPGYRLNGEHVQRSRLRVDARKWALARMNPKKYGDKVTHASDPENPLPAQQVTIFALPDNGRG